MMGTSDTDDVVCVSTQYARDGGKMCNQDQNVEFHTGLETFLDHSAVPLIVTLGDAIYSAV